MTKNEVYQMVGDSAYLFLSINFLWGLYCVVLGWKRVKKLNFKKWEMQDDFLAQLMTDLNDGRYENALELCENDPRALPRLAHVAITHRDIGHDSLRQLLSEVVQRDVLGEMDWITGWLATVIKSGPLLGLFGTVLGMMASFGRIGTGEKVEPTAIADDISIALICTGMGLATAIPFNYLLNVINVRVNKLRDSLMSGLVRLLEFFEHSYQ